MPSPWQDDISSIYINSTTTDADCTALTAAARKGLRASRCCSNTAYVHQQHANVHTLFAGFAALQDLATAYPRRSNTILHLAAVKLTLQLPHLLPQHLHLLVHLLNVLPATQVLLP